MQNADYQEIVAKQRQFFSSGATRPVAFRIAQLKKLKSILIDYEDEIRSALKKDLNKPPAESFISEILPLQHEIDYIIKHLKKWAKPQKVGTPFPISLVGHSKIYYEPYGCTLIIAPWNYPFLLLMSPLVGAICAGNCAVLKPSEIATHTQSLIISLISQSFAPEYITTVQGGTPETSQLLQVKFDYIFFTGGGVVGKIIMEAAAKHLTPVTLELGGKSPCIVDQTANLDFAAKRIVWGKFMNAGQTCIAPDYLFVHHSCKETLVEKIQASIKQFYGDNPANSESYGRIINTNHFNRLNKLLENGTILAGGTSNESDRYLAPTLIDGVSMTDPIMQQEIFGPILPIFTFNIIDDVITSIKSNPKPLALYLFTNDKETEHQVLANLSFGGGCINDCLLQIVNYNLPFGGVGASGLGAYHGRHSFETFSHRKGVYIKSWLFDFKIEYPPYTKRKLWWLKHLA